MSSKISHALPSERVPDNVARGLSGAGEATATDLTQLDAKGLQAKLQHLDDAPFNVAPDRSGSEPLAINSYIVAAVQTAASKGVRLLVGTDFSEFQRYLDQQPESPAVSAVFSSEPGTVAVKDGFWIIGIDARGNVIHTQAMRLIEPSGASLAEHLQQHFLSYIPSGREIDPASAGYVPSLGCHSITGRVVHHGQFWLKSCPDNYLGSGLIAVLPRLALALALRHWSPDFIFGFINPQEAYKGLAAREGYMHLEPGNLRWTPSTSSEPIDGWLVWMSQADIDYLLGLGLSDIVDKLEGARTA